MLLNRSIFLLAVSIFLPVAGTFAQNYGDVLRYSEKFPQGTARTVGAGSAFGALGADFGSLNINPAGLGIFRQPQYSVGLGINKNTSSGNYLGSENFDDKYNLNIPNLGLIFVTEPNTIGRTTKWKNVNYAVGFNRSNNFHAKTAIQGENSNTSVLSSWAENANGVSPGNLSRFSFGGLAYQAYLIDPVENSTNEYFGAHEYESPAGLRLRQSDYTFTRGATNDIFFGIGGNYDHRFYFGGNLLLSNIRYRYTRDFFETNISDTIRQYYFSRLKESVNTSGVGFTAQLGFLFRATEQLRLGASFSLPTFYSLNDKYSYEIQGSTDLFGDTTAISGPAEYSYSMVTPMRTTFSGAWLYSKFGFISADYEIVDYRSGRINTDFEGSRVENNIIREVYKTGHNIRIGTEWRYDVFAFRGGLGFYGSPFKSEYVLKGATASTNTYSLGAGYREGNLFIDVAYQIARKKSTYTPYTISTSEVESAVMQNSRSTLMFTIGSRF